VLELTLETVNVVSEETALAGTFILAVVPSALVKVV